MKGLEYQRQQRITQALRMYSWLHVWFRPARTDKGWRTPLSGDPGFPDIVAVHPERSILLFLEIKANGKRLTREQQAWGDALCGRAAIYGACEGVNFEYYVINSDEAEQRLLALISDGKIGQAQ